MSRESIINIRYYFILLLAEKFFIACRSNLGMAFIYLEWSKTWVFESNCLGLILIYSLNNHSALGSE